MFLIARVSRKIHCCQSRSRDLCSKSSELLDPIEKSLLLIPEVHEGLELYKAEKYTQAIPLFQRALEICTSSLGPQSEITLRASKKLGNSYFSLGQFASAETLYHQNLQGSSKVGDFMDAAHDLLRVYLYQGKYQDSLKVCDKMENHNEYKDSKLEDQLFVQMIRGISLILEGSQCTLGMKLLDEARSLSESQPCSPVIQAKILRNLGGSCFAGIEKLEGILNASLEKESVEALQYLNKAHQLLSSSITSTWEEKILKADVEIDLGYAFLCSKDYTAAAAHLGKSLNALNSLVPQKNLRIARNLKELACVYHHNQNAVTSEGLFLGALAIYEEKNVFLSIGDQIEYCRTLGAYSNLLSKWDKREKDSENYFLKATAIKSRLGLESSNQTQAQQQIPLLNQPFLSFFSV